VSRRAQERVPATGPLHRPIRLAERREPRPLAGPGSGVRPLGGTRRGRVARGAIPSSSGNLEPAAPLTTRTVSLSVLDDLLWPRPQTVRRLDETLRLRPGIGIASEVPGHTDEAISVELDTPLRTALDDAGIPVLTHGETSFVRLRLVSREHGAEGYRLCVGSRGVEIEASTRIGLRRGVTTFSQWARLAARKTGDEEVTISGVEIEDWPDLGVRGVLLDVSRNRVPTRRHLASLVRRLSGWKINQLQLYTEHTFAYLGHEAVWRDWSPLSGDDVRWLDELCSAHGIELVPNQNSFGHFHRWLAHEPYRWLAECPDGIDHPFSPFAGGREPFSLCATDPRTLELLDDLYGQLLPNFRSALFNVGLDETFDLGQGRSAEECERRGKGRVYLDFLRRVHGLVDAHGRRMQFWGDIILEHPELIAELPEDAIALAWGYEADHPFAEQAQRFAESGREFYLCPGTSSWNSFAGRTENALANLAAAARAAAESGASGLLDTDWGDFGHLQPPTISALGLLAGAGFAWNRSTAERPLDVPIAEILDLHAFAAPGSGLGAAARDLGSTYRLCGTPARNGSPLFRLLVFPHQDLTHPRYRGLSPQSLEAALEHVAEQRRHLAGLGTAGHEDELAARELLWVCDALEAGCRLGLARLDAGKSAPLGAIPRPERRALGARIGALAEGLPELWLASSRSGGLHDSLSYLERPRSLLLE